MLDQLPLFEMPDVAPDWPFAPLEPGAFEVVVADPPWRFLTYSEKGKEKKSAERHYATMGLSDIQKLPVAQLGAPDCALFLWATAPMLPEALDTMKAWDFTYKTHAIWGKQTVHGKVSFGTGYRLRNSHEIWLLGVRGNPKNTKGERSLILSQVREHSRKPDEFYAMVERWLPNVRRADLFSRQARPNWESWGLECEKFTPPHPDTIQGEQHVE